MSYFQEINRPGEEDQIKYFHFDPLVEDSTDNTMIVCHAQQLSEDDILYHSVSNNSLKIVYPPQPQTDDIFVTSGLNQTVTVNIIVQAYPLPYFSDIVWNIESNGPSTEVLLFYQTIN